MVMTFLVLSLIIALVATAAAVVPVTVILAQDHRAQTTRSASGPARLHAVGPSAADLRDGDAPVAAAAA